MEEAQQQRPPPITGGWAHVAFPPATRNEDGEDAAQQARTRLMAHLWSGTLENCCESCDEIAIICGRAR